MDIRKRFKTEGVAGLELGSRAPHNIANKTPADIEDEIVSIRKQLNEGGLDARAELNDQGEPVGDEWTVLHTWDNSPLFAFRGGSPGQFDDSLVYASNGSVTIVELEY